MATVNVNITNSVPDTDPVYVSLNDMLQFTSKDFKYRVSGLMNVLGVGSLDVPMNGSNGGNVTGGKGSNTYHIAVVDGPPGGGNPTIIVQ